MKSINKIIFTCPHSVCNFGTTRRKQICDYSSKVFTKILAEKCTNIDSILIESNQNRTIMDDNRFEQEMLIKSKLWLKLQEEIKKYFKLNKSFDNLLIMDMHSFPDRDNLDIYFLDTEPYQEILIKLNDYLNDKGYNSKILTGKIGFNSIMDLHKLHPLTIRSFLVEINEKFNNKELQKIAQDIANFLHQFSKYNYFDNIYNFYKNNFTFDYNIYKCNSIQKKDIILCLHGGAGDFPIYNPDLYREKFKQILENAYKMWQDRKNSDEISYYMVRQMEDSKLFNAGKGSIKTIDGKIQMEASIMEGSLDSGSVTMIDEGLSPIELARSVLTVKKIKKNKKNTPIRISGTKNIISYSESNNKNFKFQQVGGNNSDTVGAIAIKRNGPTYLCVASSTGGFPNKVNGRIGDTIIGHGLFANDNSCAVACTGPGEFFSKQIAASQIANLVEHGMRMCKACEIVLQKIKKDGGNGGVLCLDKCGKLIISYNSISMLWAYCDINGFISTF